MHPCQQKGRAKRNRLTKELAVNVPGIYATGIAKDSFS